MKNTVLITGGSHAEIPLIDALHSLGYFVISTGMNTDGLGHRQADLYIPADYSDKDVVLNLARENKVKGIISGCNDFAYLSTSYACQVLGIGGHDNFQTSEQIHHKNIFRSVLKRNNLSFPNFKLCSTKEDIDKAKITLKLPLLVKPTDLTGGKGVAICYDWEQVFGQFDVARAVTRQPFVLLEEMVEGTNHGVSALLKQKKVCFSFFDNEEYYLNPYLVSGAYSPSDLTEGTKKEIIRQIEVIADDLQLCDGLFHCQCIVNASGIPYLIDPCRRAPGDLYIKLVSYATGINYPLAIVKGELGLSFEEELSYQKTNRNIARECLMTDRNGVIKTIQIADGYKDHIFDQMLWGKRGDLIDDYLKYKAGIMFFEYPTFEELRDKMKARHKFMRIEVDTSVL